MTVLVENDKIVSLKEKGSVPEGFEEIDLQGRYPVSYTHLDVYKRQPDSQGFSR